MSVWLGVDPGVGGALATMNPAGITVEDMPVIKAAKGRLYDIKALADILDGARADRPIDRVIVEHMQPIRGIGVKATFHLGFAQGMLEALLTEMGIPYELVRPGRWRKALGLTGTNGNERRLRAIQMWPALAEDLRLKKHDGRADALFLAEWGRRHG